MLASQTATTPSSAASAALQSCASNSQAVLASEVEDIAKAVDGFLRTVPRDLLLHEPSALPDADRIAIRRRHLIQCGASSVRNGTAFLRQWLAFCSHRSIPNYGLPIDADLMNMFLSTIHAEARRRSLGKAKQTGASVQHSMACAARWVSDHAGLPFTIAKQQCVRKTSAPVRERDPSWSEAWEPAVILHLLRVALNASEPPLVRAYAASTYMVCVASLRLVNGRRSAPPVMNSAGVFHGVAALSKGRRRSSMAPKPWSVPCVSPDPTFSESDVSTGLHTAMSFLPPASCSMFPCLLDGEGRDVGLGRAVSASATARAADAKLITSITVLLTLPPLLLSKAEARSVAPRKHGPRHIFPEIGRMMGLPEAARNELDLWASLPKGGTALPNRYSRDAERLLSKLLRSLVLRHIRSRMPSFQRVGLDHFATSPAEMQLAFETQPSRRCVGRNECTIGIPHRWWRCFEHGQQQYTHNSWESYQRCDAWPTV